MWLPIKIAGEASSCDCCTPGDCPISALGLEYSLIGKPGTKLLLGPRFFFLIGRNLSLSWMHSEFLVLLIKCPSCGTWPTLFFSTLLQPERSMCCPLSCIGCWEKPLGYEKLAHSADTDLDLSLLLVSKAFFCLVSCVLRSFLGILNP